MTENRIKQDMNLFEAMSKLSGGNPGALTVLIHVFKENESIDPDDAFKGLGPILSLDTLGIYDERIWMLYKDVCREDLAKMLAVLRAWQLGFLGFDKLNHAIDNYGEGIDMPSLVSQVKERLPKFGRGVLSQNEA